MKYRIFSRAVLCAGLLLLCDPRHLTSASDAGGWYPFQIPTLDATDNAVHIGQRVLDPPAGKHGFVTVRDGHFVFEDGTRFRIWGTNLTFEAAFPDKATAPRVAAKLAKLGYNCIRFHHIDNPRCLFKDQPVGSSLSPEMMDRLDFFTHELKKRGIYYNFNLQVGRNFSDADGIPAGSRTSKSGKLITLFYPKVVALEKAFAKMFLTHKNVYTALRYVDDPALAAVEITNENTLWGTWAKGGLNRPLGSPRSKYYLPQPYLDYLNQDFNAWLLRKYGSREDLERAWQGRGRGLQSQEDPAKGTVKRITPQEFNTCTEKRIEDIVRYYHDLHADFFSDMTRYLKMDLGVKAAVTTTHHYAGMPGLLAQARADYMDTHGYWDHPKWHKKGKVFFRAHFLSWVAHPAFQPRPGMPADAGPVMRYALCKVQGKPLTVSEYQASEISAYAYEMPLIVGAYAGYHDWDGMYSFGFADHAERYAPGPLTKWHQISNNTVHQILTSVASLAFLRGDVQHARQVLIVHYTDRDIFGDAARKFPPSKAYMWWGKPIPDWAAYVLPVQRDIRPDGRDAGPYHLLDGPDPRRYANPTGELVWDIRNEGDEYMMINTPRFQGIVGHLANRTGLLRNLDVDGPGSAALAVISLDDRPLSHTKHALLVAVADQKGRGEKLLKQGDILRWEPGRPPFFLEPVPVSLHFKAMRHLVSMRVFALDERGDRREAVPLALVDKEGWLRLGHHAAPWYEIVVE